MINVLLWLDFCDKIWTWFNILLNKNIRQIASYPVTFSAAEKVIQLAVMHSAFPLRVSIKFPFNWNGERSALHDRLLLFCLLGIRSLLSPDILLRFYPWSWETDARVDLSMDYRDMSLPTMWEIRVFKGMGPDLVPRCKDTQPALSKAKARLSYLRSVCCRFESRAQQSSHIFIGPMSKVLNSLRKMV